MNAHPEDDYRPLEKLDNESILNDFKKEIKNIHKFYSTPPYPSVLQMSVDHGNMLQELKKAIIKVEEKLSS